MSSTDEKKETPVMFWPTKTPSSSPSSVEKANKENVARFDLPKPISQKTDSEKVGTEKASSSKPNHLKSADTESKETDAASESVSKEAVTENKDSALGNTEEEAFIFASSSKLLSTSTSGQSNPLKVNNKSNRLPEMEEEPTTEVFHAIESTSPIELSTPTTELRKNSDSEAEGLSESLISERPTLTTHPVEAPKTIEFGDDTPAPADAPDLSNEPIKPKSEFERTLVFDKTENRWDDATKYELPKVDDKVGCYRIISELGRGGFGAVYKAKNLTLGREEALKLILPSAKSECDDIEKRFEREIDIVSRLEHPNIVRLYSSGSLKHGILWMTMELIRGDRLDDRLSLHGAMKFDKAKNIILQLLCGLEEAHRRQIIHRDLKPANIMLSKKEGYADQVIILDFGLSKALGASEDANVQEVTVVDSRRVYGTPQYMAPEQLNNGRLGPWTDVYSAGLIFFELLTGSPAVNGDSIFDIAFKQSYDPIIFPPSLQETAIEAVIQKACAKNPAERYKDAGEFFDALQHIEDATDPVSVLNNDKLSGRTLPSIGMLSKTRDETSMMKTQLGLGAIVPDTSPIQHVERTGSHQRLSTSMIVLMFFLIMFTVLFLAVFVGYAIGLIDIVLK